MGDYSKLPKWAQNHIEALSRRADGLSEALRIARREAAPRQPWAYVGPYADNVPVAGRGDTIRVPFNSDYLDITPHSSGNYLWLSSNESLIVQPQSGNVIKVAPAHWL